MRTSHNYISTTTFCDGVHFVRVNSTKNNLQEVVSLVWIVHPASRGKRVTRMMQTCRNIPKAHAGTPCTPVQDDRLVPESKQHFRIFRKMQVNTRLKPVKGYVPVTIVGSTPYCYNRTIEHEFVSFHGQLMCSCDEIDCIMVCKFLRDVCTKEKSGPTRRETPSRYVCTTIQE